MSPNVIEVIQNRTFLEFFELGADAEGEHELLMRRAKTQPNQQKTVADPKVISIDAAADCSGLSTLPRLLRASGAPPVRNPEVKPANEARPVQDARGNGSSHSCRSSSDLARTQSGDSTISNSTTATLSSELSDGRRTTLMLRHLPCDYNRKSFLEFLDSQCLAGEYDFAYFPMDFKTNSGMGYAFVNFTSHEEALRAWEVLDGYNDWFVPSVKVCKVQWSGPVQGLAANIERYRNSPVMHAKVPELYKPAIFSNGVRIPYPKPEKKIKYMPFKPANGRR